MSNSNKETINLNEEISKNKKTIQFYNDEGVKKVFDIHRYSERGTLYFKRKNQTADAAS